MICIQQSVRTSVNSAACQPDPTATFFFDYSVWRQLGYFLKKRQKIKFLNPILKNSHFKFD